ncbi:TetR family transcriptional regulator [Piscinibacter sp.]|uniref:TetR family transcriptional regulator n=1 Tax=Piscinibacter sp. TaxID=1903157 RepID=UPI002C288F0F|nr:TetR family transcriptional regulator [Albitalea sp.]HUG23421.1 TetR family transcriptional regulator [Albitalea sp.]
MTTGSNGVRQAILDAALELGEQHGWDDVQLHEVALRAGVTLAEIRHHFEHKDAFTEAWFDRADAALLAMPQTPGWDRLTPRQRLHAAIAAWLDALATHRRMTAVMVRYKFQPEHLHLQAMGVMRISRTVQWIRDVALLPEVGWRREVGEAALTTIYLATFARWLADDSPGAQKTLALLDRLLAAAEQAALRFTPRG